ncbi:MAG: prenyltransferase [Chloroflexi bacterium]|nr:prenyltransferase [Chloroflexota bacterium]
MNVSMWGKALRTIPRITTEEWNGLDIISKWLIASRAGVLIITFISAGIAGLLALRDGKFNAGLWLLLTFGLLMAHATNNLLNDVTDFKKGVDQDNYFRAQYGPQTLTHGLLTMRQILAYAAVSGVLALAAGSYLVVLRGPLALWLLVMGAFFVLFYTWPLKYIGLGELAVVLVWGPLMIGGGYFVITGGWNWNVVLAGLPYALGATSVIFGKHIDKYEGDKAKRIFTLPVLIGERLARYAVAGMMVAQYALVVYLVVIGFFSPVLLVVFFAAQVFMQAWKVYGRPKPAAPPAEYPAGAWPLWFVAFAFQHNRRFGLLFLLGLLADLAWRGIVLLIAR